MYFNSQALLGAMQCRIMSLIVCYRDCGVAGTLHTPWGAPWGKDYQDVILGHWVQGYCSVQPTMQLSLAPPPYGLCSPWGRGAGPATAGRPGGCQALPPPPPETVAVAEAGMGSWATTQLELPTFGILNEFPNKWADPLLGIELNPK